MNKLGNPKHGGHGTLTYARWKSMMQRCHNPKASNFKHYGAKGVTVCDRWHDFALFLADMGECPDRSMTLDRLKNERGYEPGNCRWATQAEQNRNRSCCIQLTHNGVTQTATDWAKTLGMRPQTLIQRLALGWTVERALTTPVGTPANRHPALKQLSHDGETKSLIDWARQIGMTPNALRARLRLGWSLDRALTTPPGNGVSSVVHQLQGRTTQ